MNELCLFAGGGGGLLASKHLLGWRTVCYVEREPYCIEIIKARIRDGLLDDAPIWDDARTFDGRPWRGCVDIVTAGLPCQPFSVAGQKKAGGDDRNMWPDTLRIIRQVQPEWVLLENVPGLLSGTHGYFGQILGELAESGYDAQWRSLSAAEVGAPHRRDRLWVVAHATGSCPGGQGEGNEDARLGFTSSSEGFSGEQAHANVAHTSSTGLAQREASPQQAPQPPVANGGWWSTEPDVGRVANGVASRVDRLKALGNGQVPLVAAVAWELLTASS